MIYKIENKYYIKLYDTVYKEVKLSIKNKELIIEPTKNKLESNSDTKISVVDIDKEKEKLANKRKETSYTSEYYE